jgi:hypothetical protein
MNVNEKFMLEILKELREISQNLRRIADAKK